MTDRGDGCKDNTVLSWLRIMDAAKVKKKKTEAGAKFLPAARNQEGEGIIVLNVEKFRQKRGKNKSELTFFLLQLYRTIWKTKHRRYSE